MAKVMKLSTLCADHYRSLRSQEIRLSDFNLFIGANGSGKSTILDALRFLGEAVRARDVRDPVFTRGGVLHLSWKGEDAQRIELRIQLEDTDRNFEWALRLVRRGYEFHVEEHWDELHPGSPPLRLLEAARGQG